VGLTSSRRAASAAAAAVAALCVAPAGGTAHSLPKLLGDSRSRPGYCCSWQIRPASIVYTGDGSGVLGGVDGVDGRNRPGHLSWRKWARTQALGSGAVWLDDCTPDCAKGTFHPYPVQVVAFRPVKGHFTRLTLRYTYHGKREIDRRGISRAHGYWSYYIVGHP
jgi:hypothetical protein